MQHVSHLHSKFALRPHQVWKRPQRTGEEIRKNKKKIETTAAKYNGLRYWVAIITDMGLLIAMWPHTQ